MRKTLVCSGIIALAACIALVPAVNADEYTDKVDSLFDKLDSTQTPGAALAIIRDGRIIYKRGYGMANLDLGIAITPKSVLRIGSTSKQFTAMCTAILATEGKIDLDAAITKYIPELPANVYGPVTVRHMVHHISGIRDVLGLQAFRGITDEDYYNAEDALEVLSWQTSLNFKPGEQYVYSNSGYILQAVIVERVTGKTLAQFAKERIFDPLGMENTHFHDDHTMIVPNRATGYAKADGVYKISTTNQEYLGDGGIFTTVEDMFRWDQSFYSKPFGEKVYELVLTPGVLNSGEQLEYAFGLHVTDYKGLRVVEHGGAYVGYRAEMIRFPAQRFSVVCLMNFAEGNPTELCHKIADIYLADLLKEEKKADEEKADAAGPELSETDLNTWVGLYHLGGESIAIEFKVNDGILTGILSEYIFHFEPIGPSEFISSDGPVSLKISFSVDPNSGEKSALVKLEGQESFEMRKVEVSPPTEEQLAEYVGRYYCEDLRMTYRVVLENGNLFIRFYHGPEDPLFFLGKDEFSFAGMISVKFLRGDDQKVSGFTMEMGRVSNLRFVRKD